MKKVRKKGLGFEVILIPFMIIFLVLFQITFVEYGDVPSEVNFGDLLQSTATLSSSIVAQETYLDSLSLELTNSFLEIYIKSYVISCEDQGEIFFLDQKKNISCFSELNVSSEVFTSNFVLAIQNEFSSFENLLNSENMEVSFTTNELSNLLIISSDFSTPNLENSISLIQKKEITVDVSEDLVLLSQLKENINLLSLELQTKLPQCTILGNSKEECIKKLSTQYLKKNIINFEFEVEYKVEENFFIVDVSIINKIKSEEYLSFKMRFEDNVPFYHVGFEVEPYTLQDNILKVSIEKPRELGKNLHGFIILYSYENFFDSTTPGYDNLITLLSEKQKVPNDFEEIITPYGENNKIELRRSSDSFSSDITLAFVPVEGNNLEKTSVLLHQIYDRSQVPQRYSKLIEGKEIFVYVFAVDKSYSYYVDEKHFTSGIQSSVVEKFLPPKPLSSSTFSKKDIFELDRGIAFSLFGYDDESFNSYTMYLCPTKIFSGLEDYSSCETVISNTFTQKEGEYILFDSTQDLSLLSSYSSFHSLSITQNLIPGEDYFLYILPQNSEGNVIGSKKTLQYELSDKETFFLFSKFTSGSNEALLEPFFTRFIAK